MELVNKLWQFVNKDITGREEILELTDGFFGKVVYFGKKGQGGHWEAELRQPKSDDKFSVVIPASKDASLEPYAQLMASLIEDTDSMFKRCQQAFEIEWVKWVNGPFPARWKETFVLNCITLPENAELSDSWSVCYFVNPADRYFTARFQNGKVNDVIVDG